MEPDRTKQARPRGTLPRGLLLAGAVLLAAGLAALGVAGSREEPAATQATLLAPPSSARLICPDAFDTLYTDGAFAKAARLCQAAAERDDDPGRSAGLLTLSARALLAHVTVLGFSGRRSEALEKGEEIARRAIALDPDAAEAHLHVAVALGYRGRMLGNVAAHVNGIGKEARTHLDRAISLAPENPYGHAVLGAWHLEIVAGGGPVMAEMLYGASKADGIEAFDRARALAPENMLFDVQYAVSILVLSVERHRLEAAAILRGVVRRRLDGAIERHFQGIARDILSALETQDDIRLEALLRRARGIPDPGD